MPLPPRPPPYKLPKGKQRTEVLHRTNAGVLTRVAYIKALNRLRYCLYHLDWKKKVLADNADAYVDAHDLLMAGSPTEIRSLLWAHPPYMPYAEARASVQELFDALIARFGEPEM